MKANFLPNLAPGQYQYSDLQWNRHQRILGSNNFFNLLLTAATAREIRFASGQYHHRGRCRPWAHLPQGAAGPNRLVLCTENAGVCGAGTWNLNLQGTKAAAAGDFDWLDVRNSNASTSLAGLKPVIGVLSNNMTMAATPTGSPGGYRKIPRYQRQLVVIRGQLE